MQWEKFPLNVNFEWDGIPIWARIRTVAAGIRQTAHLFPVPNLSVIDIFGSVLSPRIMGFTPHARLDFRRFGGIGEWQNTKLVMDVFGS